MAACRMVQIGLLPSSASSAAGSWTSAGTSWPGPQIKNGALARRARARIQAQQHAQGLRIGDDWQPDDHIPAFSGQHRRRLLATAEQQATAERLMARGIPGSPAVEAGRPAR